MGFNLLIWSTRFGIRPSAARGSLRLGWRRMGLQSGMPLASGQTTSPSVLYSKRALQNVMSLYTSGKGSGSLEQQTAWAWCTKMKVGATRRLMHLQIILQDMLSSRCQQAGSLMLLAKSYLLSSVHSAMILSLQPGNHRLGSQHFAGYITLLMHETTLMHVLDAVCRI